MKKSNEHAARGFEILAKREDAYAYFDVLLSHGLLDAAQNPGPIEIADKPGFFRVPYWRALDYLSVVAKQAGDLGDLALADKLISVQLNVSNRENPDGSKVDNYHTFWKFAEILGFLPVQSLSDPVLALVPEWLRSKYDRSLVAKTISDGVMNNLLDSSVPEDHQRACLILGYCTEFVRSTEEPTELTTVVDEYWLREMFARHAKNFGSRAGSGATRIIEDRLRGVFGDGSRPYRSSLWRPAIEDHDQNRGHSGPENLFVEGLRDITLSWIDSGDGLAEEYLVSLIDGDLDILKRIALHIIDERFDRFKHLTYRAINGVFFSAPYRHELYRLLDRRFAEFSDESKSLTIDAIRSIPLPESGTRRAIYRAHIQREWASAIRDKNYQPADDLFDSLNSRKGLGPLSQHPDFLSYSSMHSGPGPSPFTPEFLIAAAKDGSLIDKTSSFKEADGWRGPTEGGLWQTLETTVSSQPDVFLDTLENYSLAPFPFIHALISGLSEPLRNEQDVKRGASRAKGLWEQLFDYFELLLSEPAFWAREEAEHQNFLPRRGWILTLIADVLIAGTRADRTAYPTRLLGQGWRIVQILLDRTPRIVELEDADIVTQVINTARGRAIEAAVNHSLRVCRLESKNRGSHDEAWERLQPVFDKELADTTGGNFEFSTLVAQYLANFDYLSPTWLGDNFGKLFNPGYTANFRSALAGLVYSSLTSRVYALLVRHDVIRAGLDARPRKDQELRRLVEFTCLALMWGDEDLASPQFAKLYESGTEGEISAAADWFWSIQDGKTTEKQRRAILAFWKWALKWCSTQRTSTDRLMSKLTRLSGFLTGLDEKSLELLAVVAPYASSDYNFDYLAEQLIRLAPSSPQNAVAIAELMISRNRPSYDMDDHFKTVLRYLAANGQRVRVLELINSLMTYLPGMLDFYNEISGASPEIGVV